MGQNKWLICSFLSLVLCAIPGGMGMMLGVGLCVICTGGCFLKWVYEEDKYQREEYKKYFKKLKEKLDKRNCLCYNKYSPKGTKNNTKEVTVMKELVKNEKEVITMDEIIKSAKDSHDEYQAKLKQIVSKLNNIFSDLSFIQFIDDYGGSNITLGFDCADDNTIIVSVKDV